MPRLVAMTQHNDTSDTAQTNDDIAKFLPGDFANPRNWPSWRKWTVVASIGLVDLTVSFGASGFSPASGSFAEEFGLSHQLSHLGLSLYVLGLAFGPMLIVSGSIVTFPGIGQFLVFGRRHMCPGNEVVNSHLLTFRA